MKPVRYHKILQSKKKKHYKKELFIFVIQDKNVI